MKNKFFYLIVIIAFINACSPSDNNGITISGNIKNSNNDFVLLSYAPRLRGNLNFDGFKSIGIRTDKNGHFILKSNTIKNASGYFLDINNNWNSLILFKGDDLTIEYDLTKPDSSFFVLGKGASKINIEKLKQFEFDLNFNSNYTIKYYKSRIDSVVDYQISLLESIRNKDLNSKYISLADNKGKIERIIKTNTLSQEEYNYLKNRILVQKTYLVGFISYLLGNDKTDPVIAGNDFSVFNELNSLDFNEYSAYNDWHFQELLDYWLQYKFLKAMLGRGEKLNLSNLINTFKSQDFYEWESQFVRDSMDTEIGNKYFSERCAYLMLLGYDDDSEKYYEILKTKYAGRKYLSRIDAYRDLIKNGLNNPAYHLGSADRTLDKKSLEKLINEDNEKSIYLIFWSARFAGASIFRDLPAIKDFESNYSNQLKMVNICIDEEKYKGLWAAGIIDNYWKANHYFMPVEGNDSTLNKFNITNINTFCYGGATYSIINANGAIINNVESPLLMTNEKLGQYLSKTVR